MHGSDQCPVQCRSYPRVGKAIGSNCVGFPGDAVVKNPPANAGDT